MLEVWVRKEINCPGRYSSTALFKLMMPAAPVEGMFITLDGVFPECEPQDSHVLGMVEWDARHSCYVVESKFEDCNCDHEEEFQEFVKAFTAAGWTFDDPYGKPNGIGGRLGPKRENTPCDAATS